MSNVKLSDANGRWKTLLWLKANNLASPVLIPGKTPSHYLLDGGAWYVPLDRMEEFHRVLAFDIANNISVPISELATPFHRLFVDIDGRALQEPQLSHYFRLGQAAVHTVHRFLNRDEGVGVANLRCSCIVLTTEPRLVWDEATHNDIFKFGVHLVFPDVVVDHEAQIFFAEQYACNLEKDASFILPPLSPINTPHSLVDMQVYQSANATKLRMPRVWKADKCLACESKREKRDQLQKQLDPVSSKLKRPQREEKEQELRTLIPQILACDCGGRGRYHLPYTYKVACVVRSDGKLDKSLTESLLEEDQIFELLKLCGIRTAETKRREDFVIPPGAAKPSKHRLDASTNQWVWHDSKPARLIGESVDSDDVYGVNGRNGHKKIRLFKQIDACEPAAQAWLTMFRTHKTRWGELAQRDRIEVYNIQKDGSSEPDPIFAKMHLCGPGCRACDNVTDEFGGEHNTSEMNSILTIQNVMYQRCACKKSEKCTPETGRKHGACSDLKSKKMIKIEGKLPIEHLESIFGKEAVARANHGSKSVHASARQTGHDFHHGDEDREEEEEARLEQERAVLVESDVVPIHMDNNNGGGNDDDGGDTDGGSSRHVARSQRKRRTICEDSDADDDQASILGGEIETNINSTAHDTDEEDNEEDVIHRRKRTRRVLTSYDEDDEEGDGGETTTASTRADTSAETMDDGEGGPVIPTLQSLTLEQMMYGEEFQEKSRKNEEIRKRKREYRLQRKMKKAKQSRSQLDGGDGGSINGASVSDQEDDDLDVNQNEYLEEESDGGGPSRSRLRTVEVEDNESYRRGEGSGQPLRSDADATRGSGLMKLLDDGPLEVSMDFIDMRDGEIVYNPLKTNQVTVRDNVAASKRMQWELEKMRVARLSRYDTSVSSRMKNTQIEASKGDGIMPVTLFDGTILFRDINTQTGRNVMLHDWNIWVEKHHQLFAEQDILFNRKPDPRDSVPVDPEELQKRKELKKMMETSRMVYYHDRPQAAGFSYDILHGAKLKEKFVMPQDRASTRTRAPPPPDSFSSTLEFQRFLRDRDRRDKLGRLRTEMGRKRNQDDWSDPYASMHAQRSLFSIGNIEACERILCTNAPRAILDLLQIDRDHYKKMDAHEEDEEQYKGEKDDRKAMRRAHAISKQKDDSVV